MQGLIYNKLDVEDSILLSNGAIHIKTDQEYNFFWNLIIPVIMEYEALWNDITKIYLKF